MKIVTVGPSDEHNLLGGAAIVSRHNLLGGAAIVSRHNLLGGAAIVSRHNLLGGAAIVSSFVVVSFSTHSVYAVATSVLLYTKCRN
jgi:hypothetical protein